MKKRYVIYQIVSLEVKTNGDISNEWNDRSVDLDCLENTNEWFDSLEEAEYHLFNELQNHQFKQKLLYTIITEYVYSK